MGRNWKETKFPSTGEWINQLWYDQILFNNKNEWIVTHNMDESQKHYTKWKKKSDTNTSYRMIHLYEGLEKAKLLGQRDQMRGWEQGERTDYKGA